MLCIMSQIYNRLFLKLMDNKAFGLIWTKRNGMNQNVTLLHLLDGAVC